VPAKTAAGYIPINSYFSTILLAIVILEHVWYLKCCI